MNISIKPIETKIDFTIVAAPVGLDIKVMTFANDLQIDILPLISSDKAASKPGAGFFQYTLNFDI